MSIERNGAEPTGIVRTTRNLFDGVFENGTIDSSSGLEVNYGTTIRCKNYIRVSANQLYTITQPDNNVNSKFRFYNTNKDYVGYIDKDGNTFGNKKSMSFYPPTDGFLKICCDNISNLEYKIQLELGTEATPYVPHKVSATKVVRTTRNFFDIEKWLENYGAEYTKNGKSYRFRVVSSMYQNPMILFNSPTTLTISGTINNITTINGRFSILLNGNTRTSFNGTTRTIENVVGIGFDWNTSGEVEVSNIQLELGTEATPYIPHLITVWENQEEGD